MEYLTSGITSNFDMYLFSPDNARASVDCGFRTVEVSGMNDFMSSVEEMEEHYHIVNEMSDLTSYILGFHAEYTTSKERMEGVAALAHKLKSPVFLHNSETEREVQECIGRYGCTPTQITDKLGMYEYGGGGYHCVWMDDTDFDIFKKHGLTAVTNPASNLKLASGIAPLKRYVDEGISVAIGTDGPASNNCLDMFREMFLATGLAKVRERDASCIRADEVLYMATAGGAHAMCLDDCDSLAVGKKADIIMLDLKQPNMQPENNIIKNIVYSGSKQNVKMTMVNGKILYEDQKFHIGFEPEDVYQKANEIIGRMK
jgi:5-methylthioadenosine/S-adenosylhomocysteine deaminase